MKVIELQFRISNSLSKFYKHKNFQKGRSTFTKKNIFLNANISKMNENTTKFN